MQDRGYDRLVCGDLVEIFEEDGQAHRSPEGKSKSTGHAGAPNITWKRHGPLHPISILNGGS